jgi:hypothetical protein
MLYWKNVRKINMAWERIEYPKDGKIKTVESDNWLIVGGEFQRVLSAYGQQWVIDNVNVYYYDECDFVVAEHDESKWIKVDICEMMGWKSQEVDV